MQKLIRTSPQPGLILATTLIIAASISLYENPQVREWIEEGRRRIVLAFNGDGGVEVVDLDQEEEFAEKDAEQQLKDKERRDRIFRRNLYRHGLAGLGRGVEGEGEKIKERGGSFDDFLTSEGRLRDVSLPPTSRSRGFEVVKEKNLPSLLDTANSTAVLGASSALEGGSIHHRNPVFSEKRDFLSRSPTLSASSLVPAPLPAPAFQRTNSEDVLFPSTLSTLNSPAPQAILSNQRRSQAQAGAEARGDLTPTSSSFSPATLSPISHSQEDLLDLDLQDQASLERSISEWEEGFMSSSASVSVSADEGAIVSRTMSRSAGNGGEGSGSESEGWSRGRSQSRSRNDNEEGGGGGRRRSALMSDCGSEADWVSDAGIHTPGSWMSVGDGSSVAGEGDELGRR
jgi:hypothetical protein